MHRARAEEKTARRETQRAPRRNFGFARPQRRRRVRPGVASRRSNAKRISMGGGPPAQPRLHGKNGPLPGIRPAALPGSPGERYPTRSATMGSFQIGALKTVDRLGGRTLYRLLLASARRQGLAGDTTPPPPPENVRKVLVIRPGGIGAAVLFYPMPASFR